MKTLTFMRLIGEIDALAKHVLLNYAGTPEKQEALKDFIAEFEARIDEEINEAITALQEKEMR